MRQHLARQADGDALRPLLEQQRELDGQGLRLLVPAVIAGQPVGRLRIEKRRLGKGGQGGLDVTGCGGAVSGEDVAPVSLAVQCELPLANLHHGVADARIPVGVILHRVADGIGHLVETAIVHLLQGVQDAALDRLQSVVEVRNRPLEDHIGGIIEEVLVVHPLDADDLLHVGASSVIAFPVRLVRSGFPFRVLWQVLVVLLLVVLVLLGHAASVLSVSAFSASGSFSTRRLSMMNRWRSGVFLPMKKASMSSS